MANFIHWVIEKYPTSVNVAHVNLWWRNDSEFMRTHGSLRRGLSSQYLKPRPCCIPRFKGVWIHSRHLDETGCNILKPQTYQIINASIKMHNSSSSSRFDPICNTMFRSEIRPEPAFAVEIWINSNKALTWNQAIIPNSYPLRKFTIPLRSLGD